MLRAPVSLSLRRPVLCLLGDGCSPHAEKLLSHRYAVLRYPVAGADVVASRFDCNPVGSIYRSLGPFVQTSSPVRWIDASNISLRESRRLKSIQWMDFQHVFFDLGAVDREIAVALVI